MADITVDLSSGTIQYYHKTTYRNTNSSDGATASEAKANAAAATEYPGYPTVTNGGSSSSTDKYFGLKDEGTTVTTSSSKVPGYYVGTCTKTHTGFASQMKINFTLPSGITVSNIGSVSLKFNCSTSWASGGVDFGVFAPKDSSSVQEQYWQYNDSSAPFSSTLKTFQITGGTTSINIDITDVFKQCITTTKGWITLGREAVRASETKLVTITSNPIITYTLAYTSCSAPTSVSVGTSIQKPGGTVTLTWSGATAGTNNAIKGYKIYYTSAASSTAPTTSSTCIDLSSNTSTSYSFSVPSNATRGNYYTFKVLTIGTVSGYNSSISSTSANFRVNSLPAAPSVTASPTMIKSSGSTTVNFTVTAGSDTNTSQTKILYYSTSESGAKTKITSSPVSVSLSNAATYYFWTSDGIEYSSSTSVSISKNTAPAINSITMTAVATFVPTVRNGYVKNINGSATVNKVGMSYQWKLLVASGVNGTNFNTITNISTNTSLSNIDVTNYGATFNTAYKLRLVVTDSLGETAQADSSTIYGIPAAPTISNVFNQKDDSDVGNANSSHFGRYIRIKYSENNTGCTRQLQYSTSNTFASGVTTINLSGTSYSDVDLNSLTRNTTYYFRVVFTCNSKTSTSSTFSRTREADITPSIGTISTFKPYTTSSITISFTNQPVAWAVANDVPTSYSSIYTIQFEYSGRNISVGISSATNSSGTVTMTLNTANIPTSGNGSWAYLINNSTNAPNSSYTVALKVIAKNGFNTSFSSTKNVTVNFVEGVISTGTPTLKIQEKVTSGSTTATYYVEIPSSYNNKTQLERFHIFQGENLRVEITGVQCYANQTATIYFMLGSTVLGQTSIAGNEWSMSGRIYTLSQAKTIDYIVPANTQAAYSNGVRDFSINVVLANGQSKLSTASGQSNGNLNTCIHYRFYPNAINFKITGVNANETSLSWTCTDFGGYTSASAYGNSYSSITVQPKYSINNSTYTDLNGIYTITDADKTNKGGTIERTISSINGDIIYFGAVLKLTLALQGVYDGAVPTLASGYDQTYSYTYNNLYNYYRATPNILYGKNFFVLNSNSPRSNANMLMEIKETQTRNTIYVGSGDTAGTLEITTGGLVIDCGSW